MNHPEICFQTNKRRIEELERDNQLLQTQITIHKKEVVKCKNKIDDVENMMALHMQAIKELSRKLNK